MEPTNTKQRIIEIAKGFDGPFTAEDMLQAMPYLNYSTIKVTLSRMRSMGILDVVERKARKVGRPLNVYRLINEQANAAVGARTASTYDGRSLAQLCRDVLLEQKHPFTLQSVCELMSLRGSQRTVLFSVLRQLEAENLACRMVVMLPTDSMKNPPIRWTTEPAAIKQQQAVAARLTF